MKQQLILRFVVIGCLSIILVGFGVFWGHDFPDTDLTLRKYLPGIIQHRSLLTHGAILPVLLWVTSYRYKSNLVRLPSLGFCASLAVHLSFDLFPYSYRGQWCHGFGCIHVPIAGRTGPTFSWMWIASGVIIALFIAFHLAHNSGEHILVFACIGITFIHMAQIEPHISYRALLTLTLLLIVLAPLPTEIYETIRHQFRKYKKI